MAFRHQLGFAWHPKPFPPILLSFPGEAVVVVVRPQHILYVVGASAPLGHVASVFPPSSLSLCVCVALPPDRTTK